jgi:hypothetical protein
VKKILAITSSVFQLNASSSFSSMD